MNRLNAPTRRYMDGVLQILKNDAANNSGKWFDVPRTFVKEVHPLILKNPFPIVGLGLYPGDFDPIEPRPLGYQRSKFVFQIHAFVRGPNIYTRVLEMHYDIARVLLANRQLQGFDDPLNPTILSGFLSVGQCKLVAWSNGTAHEGRIDVPVEIQFDWSATAP